jgi:hypothetical protein
MKYWKMPIKGKAKIRSNNYEDFSYLLNDMNSDGPRRRHVTLKPNIAITNWSFLGSNLLNIRGNTKHMGK